MRIIFADSYYYLAIVNESDVGHSAALQFSQSYHGRTVTTEWVLTEVADALSAPQQRGVFAELMEQLSADPGLTVIEASHDLFVRGTTLFADRSDKSWSLTDYISFVVMEDAGIREALTADRHFEQAGYVSLLK